MHDNNKPTFGPNDLICCVGGGTVGIRGEIRKIIGYSRGGLYWTPYTFDRESRGVINQPLHDTAGTSDPLLLEGWTRFVFHKAEPILDEIIAQVRSIGVLVDSDYRQQPVFINLRATCAEKRVIELTQEVASLQDQLNRMKGLQRIPSGDSAFSEMSTTAIMEAGITIRQASARSTERALEA